jgi:hypothetical protein
MNKRVSKEKMYYIQNGWVGNAILWWAENSNGYTTDFTKAGKYTKEHAKSIIKRPQDVAWECSHVDNCKESHKLIIDGQYLNYKRRMIGRKT